MKNIIVLFILIFFSGCYNLKSSVEYQVRSKFIPIERSKLDNAEWYTKFRTWADFGYNINNEKDRLEAINYIFQYQCKNGVIIIKEDKIKIGEGNFVKDLNMYYIDVICKK